jgi:catechol 2,3-dioxygenase-like lactoylglutathione lyase family enzyme
MRSKFELFVGDPGSSARFYAALGFAAVHRKEDGYTTLRNGEVVIALSPLPSWLPLRWLGFLRRPPLGTEIVLYPDRIEERHAELASAGYAPGPIRLQPWGLRDFRITDPDGYYLRITEGEPVPAA